MGLQEGEQIGLRKGLLVGIEDVLELKFGSQGKHLLQEITKIVDVDLLQTIRTAARDATALDDVRKAMSK